LLLHEYGLWDDQIDGVLTAQLIGSWARRQKFLARMQAIEVSKVLFGDGNPQATEVSTAKMMRMLGAPR
jgi:hypothetical protein